MMSVKREITVSVQPPKKPARMPSVPPMSAVSTVTTTAMKIEGRAP